jgi:trimeric autotransporter adhesin
MIPNKPWVLRAGAIVAACMLVGVDAVAQTATPLLDLVQSIALPSLGVPVQETFNVTAAGTYQVTLTDFGALLAAQSSSGSQSAFQPAPLASGAFAVTTNNAIVGKPVTLTNDSPTGQTSWSTQFTATAAGTYTIQVVGTPGATPGSIGLAVTNTANNAILASFSDSVALPPSATPQSSPSALFNSTLQVSASGSYQVTLTDMQLPAALTVSSLVVVTSAGVVGTPLATVSGTPTATTILNLTSGVSYQLIVIGEASGTAGLFGFNVSAASGSTGTATCGGSSTSCNATTPVGAVTSLGTPTLQTGSYTLSVADLKYPSTPLAQLASVVTFAGQPVSQLSASGTSSPFSTTAGTYGVYAYATPVSGGQGSYSVALQPASGAAALSVARAVSDPTSPILAYSYDTKIVTAQAYNLNLADFGYPTDLASASAAAVQAGAVLGTPLTSVGQTSISPSVGPLSLLVFAQPFVSTSGSAPAVTGGLFGVDIETSGGATPAYQMSQGVGNLFSVQTVSISTGGAYQVQVADLGFPANFSNISVIVTQGINKIGSIFGGATLPFTATSGDYLINIVATPDPTVGAGTYAVVVGSAPAAASVTLQASPTTLTSSGGTVTLTWSSSSTSACTASSSPSGAWSGSVPTSGTATSTAITATTTFTLSCTGTDGTTPSQSVTVTVSSASSGSHGGGSIGTDLLVMLLGALVLRLGTTRRAPGMR